MCKFWKKKLDLIDLADYEGECLIAKDQGLAIRPPAPTLTYKADCTVEEWEKIQRNQRMAEEIYKRMKS